MTHPTGILGPAPHAGYPTAIIRTPTISAAWGTELLTSYPLGLVDPTAITNVLEASTDLGLDMSVGAATFTVPEESDLHGAGLWSIVSLMLSAGTIPTPWLGYITGLGYQLYPRAVVVQCSSFLVRADQQVCLTPGGLMLPPPVPAPPIPPLGARDEDMVGTVLGQANITMPPLYLGINGTGRYLGTVAREPFRWAEGESALSFIRRLDEMCVMQTGPGGPWLPYRTYDDIGGFMRRSPIDMVPSGTPAFTFKEGLDIFSGSTNKEILPARNQVIVTGYDQGLGPGPVTNTQSGANAYIAGTVALQLSNPMVEFDTIAHLPASTGIAAEAVAKALLRIWNRTQLRVQFTTPRDDDIPVGATIKVDTYSGAGDRLGLVGNFYVLHIHRAIAPSGEFSQVLTVLSGAG